MSVPQIQSVPYIPQVIPDKADGTYTTPIVTVLPPSLSNNTYLNNLLANPQLDDISNLSTSDLITLISKNIGRVKGLLANTQALLLSAKQKDIEASAKEALQKLNDSIKQQQKAEELQRKMKIVNWFLMALSIVITVVVAVATVGTGAVVAGIVGMLISAALMVATMVPVKGGKTMMDHATEQTGKAFANIAMAIYKEHLKNTGKRDESGLTESGKTKNQETIEERSEYAAMAFMVALQVALAVIMIVASRGGTAAKSAGDIASTATKEGTNVASKAVMANVQAVANAAAKVAKVAQLATAITKVGVAGTQIHIATIEKSASLAEADTKELSAFIKFLQSILEADQKLLEMLIESLSLDASQIKNLMDVEHQASMDVQKVFTV